MITTYNIKTKRLDVGCFPDTYIKKSGSISKGYYNKSLVDFNMMMFDIVNPEIHAMSATRDNMALIQQTNYGLIMSESQMVLRKELFTVKCGQGHNCKLHQHNYNTTYRLGFLFSFLYL